MNVALATPLVTILVAAVTALWTLKTWRDDREKQREVERLRLAALYINPFLIACEELQSRLYNILKRGGLGALKRGYPEGDYAQDILYFIVQYFGWQRCIYRYYYDPQIIKLLNELREAFATDRGDYGGWGPFCFFRSQQRAFGDMIMLRTEGPFGSEFVTKDYDQFLSMLESDSFARFESVQVTLKAIRNAAEDPNGISSKVRKRLVTIQSLLVDLLDYLEKKEGISFFSKEGGRKKVDMNQRTYSESQEKAQDQTFQSRMEWLKTVYDFYKHFMTIAFASIAAVAAVAALIGDTPKTSTFGADAPLVPKVLVGAAILAFLITGYVSIQGMHLARRNILHLHEVKSEEDFKKLRQWRWGPGEQLDRENVWGVVSLSYAAGILAFIIFLVTAVF